MGDPFLRAYYSIYDLENKMLGLVGIADTILGDDDEHDEEVLIGIIIGSTVCVLIVFFLCVCYYFSKDSRDIYGGTRTNSGRYITNSGRYTDRSPRSFRSPRSNTDGSEM